MKEFTGLLVEGLAAAAVVVVSYGASLGVSGAPAPHGTAEPRGRRLRRLATPVLFPALVLLLSPVAARVAAWHDGMRPWLLAHGDHQRAWTAFWMVLLLLGCVEFLWRGLYVWRDRPFPVPALMRGILRAVVVVGVALAVVRGVLGKDI